MIPRVGVAAIVLLVFVAVLAVLTSRSAQVGTPDSEPEAVAGESFRDGGTSSEREADSAGSQTSQSAVGPLNDPVVAGEETPPGYRPILERDTIPPVYEPSFISADAVE